MKKTLTMLFAITTLSSSFAQSDQVIELVELMNPRSTVSQSMLASMGPAIAQLPTEKQIPIKNAAEKFAQKIENDPEYIQGLAAVYRNNFTDQEIASLLEFYKTPAGQKFTEKFPTMLQEISAVGFKLGEKYSAEFQMEIQNILRQ